MSADRIALPEIIETERLLLRPFRFEDADDVLGYATDEEWGRYLPVPQPYARRDAEQFLARQVLGDRVVRPTWAIVHEGRVVGGVDIGFRFQHRVATIGYSVARPLWGQGFASEASKAVVDEAFRTHPDLNRIQAAADARNVASHRVMEKLGMTREGLIRENLIIRGEITSEVWYGLLRPEWRGAAP